VKGKQKREPARNKGTSATCQIRNKVEMQRELTLYPMEKREWAKGGKENKLERAREGLLGKGDHKKKQGGGAYSTNGGADLKGGKSIELHIHPHGGYCGYSVSLRLCCLEKNHGDGDPDQSMNQSRRKG